MATRRERPQGSSRDDQRELLFDLERVRAATPEGEGRLLIDKSIGNLLRQWGEN